MASKYTASSGAKVRQFKEQAYGILGKLEAEDTEHSNRFILPTMAGDLDILVNADWLCCQFRDVDLASKLLKGTRLDMETGRWDWRGSTALESFQAAVERIMDLPGKRVCLVPNTARPTSMSGPGF
jgi:hypothetical protein